MSSFSNFTKKNKKSELKCKFHNKKINSYCENESKFLCLKCLTDNNHLNHEVYTLDDYFDRNKNNILKAYKTKLEIIKFKKQKLKSENIKINNNVNYSLNIVKSFYKEITVVINDYIKKLEKECNIVINNNLKIYNNFVNNTNNIKSDIKLKMDNITKKDKIVDIIKDYNSKLSKYIEEDNIISNKIFDLDNIKSELLSKFNISFDNSINNTAINIQNSSKNIKRNNSQLKSKRKSNLSTNRVKRNKSCIKNKLEINDKIPLKKEIIESEFKINNLPDENIESRIIQNDFNTNNTYKIDKSLIISKQIENSPQEFTFKNPIDLKKTEVRMTIQNRIEGNIKFNKLNNKKKWNNFNLIEENIKEDFDISNDFINVQKISTIDNNTCKTKSFNKLLFIGGNPNSKLLDFEIIDFDNHENNRVISNDNYPFNFYKYIVSYCDDINSLFIIGGKYNDTIYSNKIYTYNINTEEINTFYNLSKLKPNLYGMAAIIKDKELIITGGISNNIIIDNCFSINIITKELKMLQNMKTKKDSHELVLYNNSVIYSFGGYGGNDFKILNTAEKYDCKLNTWTIINPMKYSRRSLNAINYKNYIILIGGIDKDNNYCNIIEM